ncbi:hypothetical protein G6F56_012611 [Rhizopus delemar]|nr:hypothetical protein G6F56_012611 [Rhizopus delemar]
MPDSRDYEKRQHSHRSKRSRTPERKSSRRSQSPERSFKRDSSSPERSFDKNYYKRSPSPQRRYSNKSGQDNKRRRERNEKDKRYYDKRHSEDKLANPNINVVLRNLPDGATEDDISKQLYKMDASIEEVCLIKSRDTGESKKFAFVRFTSVGHAMQFVEKHRVFYMKDYRVRVDYSHKNSGSAEKEEWRCSTGGCW